MSFLRGYHGKILRVDLTSKSFREEDLSPGWRANSWGERASASSACSTKSILSPMRFRRRTLPTPEKLLSLDLGEALPYI